MPPRRAAAMDGYDGMEEGDPPAAASPETGAAALGGQGPRVKLRTFDGDVDGYKEWRREVEATALLYGIADKQLAGLVYLSLAPGASKPRDLISHLDVRSEVCTDAGMKRVWAILDREYVRESYVKADEAQARYDKCRRGPGQPMEEFIREARLTKRLLEREDPGTTISDVSFARRLLRRSGLTRLEQRGVLAAAGASWDATKIEDALKLMYGDAHQDDRRRTSEAHKGDRHHHHKGWRPSKKPWGSPKGAHFEEEWSPGGSMAAGGTDHPDEEPEEMPEEEWDGDDDAELDEEDDEEDDEENEDDTETEDEDEEAEGEWDVAAERPGLWENIRRKKEREGKNYKPAKKGDPDRPDPEAWKKAQSKFKYKDPQTGEYFYFENQGVKEKNGKKLVYVGKAAEYQGRNVQLGKPFRTPDGPKKFSVYVKNDRGNVVKVNFGDPNMKIKKNIPERRKSFRARHNCDTNPGPRWRARYWACRSW